MQTALNGYNNSLFLSFSEQSDDNGKFCLQNEAKGGDGELMKSRATNLRGKLGALLEENPEEENLATLATKSRNRPTEK